MTKLFARLRHRFDPWAHSASRVFLSPKPLPEPEPLYRDGVRLPGLWSSLTPEQKAKALAYRGEENHGSDEFRRPSAA